MNKLTFFKFAPPLIIIAIIAMIRFNVINVEKIKDTFTEYEKTLTEIFRDQ